MTGTVTVPAVESGIGFIGLGTRSLREPVPNHHPIHMVP